MSASLPKGQISVRVLEDGTVRVETGDMAGVTHQSADAFIRDLRTMLGGTETMLTPEHGHHHHHTHDHTHGEDHHHH